MDKDIYHTIYLNRWVSSALQPPSLFQDVELPDVVSRCTEWNGSGRDLRWCLMVVGTRNLGKKLQTSSSLRGRVAKGICLHPETMILWFNLVFLELHHLKTTGSWNKTGNLNIVWTSSIQILAQEARIICKWQPTATLDRGPSTRGLYAPAHANGTAIEVRRCWSCSFAWKRPHLQGLTH